jgi:predicted enzyme related to lactoylglutathione lyase
MAVETRSRVKVVGRLDLLTMDLIGAADFYHKLFDWEFMGDFSTADTTLVRGDPDEGLAVVLTGDGVLGETLGRVGRWEVFFDVASVDETVERAWRHGGDVLHASTEISDGSRVALIRDPAGAVFGIIENVPPGRAVDAIECDRGRMVGLELHTTSSDVAAHFYLEVFNWTTSADPDPSAVLFNRADRPFAGLVADPSPVLTAPSWIVYFGVPDVAEACEAVEWIGGTVLAVTGARSAGQAALVADPGGAVFGLSRL